MAKSNSGGKQRNPNSLANLKKAWTPDVASEMGKKGVVARMKKKYDRHVMKEDLVGALGAEIEVPPEIYAALKKLGIDVQKKERLSKLIMQKAMLKALKDGSTDQMLRLAEFAGFRDALKVDITGNVNERRNVIINFRRATPEDAK